MNDATRSWSRGRSGVLGLDDGRDYFRVEEQPGLHRSVLALYREVSGSFYCYRWLATAPEDAGRRSRRVQRRLARYGRLLTQFGFKPLPPEAVDATPRE